VTTVLLACACSERPRPAPALAPTRTSAPAPAAPTSTPLELSLKPPVAPGLISILMPANGEALNDDASALPVKVNSARPDWTVELGLDGRRARPLDTLPDEPTLGVLNDGEALAPGPHQLLAALRAGDQEPASFALARFSVGAKQDESEPLVYCTRPAGTYYVSAGTPLLLDFVTSGVELGPKNALRVRVARMGASDLPREAILREAGPRLIHGVDSGDFSVELELLGADDRPLPGRLARHRCELSFHEAPPP
jgi:hypothetical protein